MIYLEPFRHSVEDDYLSPDAVKAINDEWPEEWNKENGSFQLKWNNERLTETARHVADAIDIAMLEYVTGVQGLFPDPELFGAGLHCTPPGGFLNMHVDFNQHPKGWHRRCNVLIYLNEDWDDSWGGHLYLGENKEACVAPIGGRRVIFETTEHTWHGHPEPLKCPPDRQRRSLALYYYTEAPPPSKPHSTVYKKKR